MAGTSSPTPLLIAESLVWPWRWEDTEKMWGWQIKHRMRNSDSRKATNNDMEHAYNKILLVAYLEFKSKWISRILFAKSDNLRSSSQYTLRARPKQRLLITVGLAPKDHDPGQGGLPNVATGMWGKYPNNIVSLLYCSPA